MRTLRIASAARLALGGPLTVFDDRLGVALLDLRKETAEVALGKLREVVRSLAPRLYLQEGLRLLAAVGDAPLPAAAEVVARGVGQGDVSLAALRGEDLLGRLEELMRAGCELRREGRDEGLAEERRAPLAVWAEPPIESVAAPLAAGATVVLSHRGAPAALIAAACRDVFGPTAGLPNGLESLATRALLGEAIELSETDLTPDVVTITKRPVPVEAVLPSGFTTLAVADRGVEGPESMAERFRRAAQDSVLLRLQAEGPRWVIEVDAPDAAQCAEGARVAGLLCDPAAGGPTLVVPFSRPAPRREVWRTSVPAGLLEFGFDLRPSGEWIE